jgi:hypothetical protein
MSQLGKHEWKAIGSVALGLSEVVDVNRDFCAGHLVCQVNTQWFDRETGAFRRLGREFTDDRANLIAAAPCLLSACKAALVEMGGDDPCIDMDPTINQLRAAIAKAEGRTP